LAGDGLKAYRDFFIALRANRKLVSLGISDDKLIKELIAPELDKVPHKPFNKKEPILE
jgi:hypothetical protein